MNDPINIVGTSTQTVFPWRAVLRTAVQNVPGILIALITILTIVSEGYGDYLSENILTTVSSVIAFLGTSQLVFTRLMADERVDKLVEVLGLGSTPKKVDTAVIVAPHVEDEAPTMEHVSIFKFKEEE